MKPWFKTKRPFAAGTNLAVYRKRRKRGAIYPTPSYFFPRGGVVKTVPIKYKGEVKWAFKNYWALKIAHELFPKNVAEVKGLKIVKSPGESIGWVELHMKEVKLHKELVEFNNAVRERGWKNVPSELETNCHAVVNKNSFLIESESKKLFSAGIDNSMENPYNVSLAGKIPVFLEPKIYDTQLLIDYIQNNIAPKEKKERLLRFVERYKRTEDPDEKFFSKGSFFE